MITLSMIVPLNAFIFVFVNTIIVRYIHIHIRKCSWSDVLSMATRYIKHDKCCFLVLRSISFFELCERAHVVSYGCYESSDGSLECVWSLFVIIFLASTLSHLMLCLFVFAAFQTSCQTLCIGLTAISQHRWRPLLTPTHNSLLQSSKLSTTETLSI